MSGVQMWAATHGLYQFFTSLTENDKEHVFGSRQGVWLLNL